MISRTLPVLEVGPVPPRPNTDFDEKLAAFGIELRAAAVEILQVNVGKLCNQACKHCHVDASPTRTEIMTRETADQVIASIASSQSTLPAARLSLTPLFGISSPNLELWTRTS